MKETEKERWREKRMDNSLTHAKNRGPILEFIL